MTEIELWRGRKTHCKHGHKLTAKTVTVNIRTNGTIQRQCRVCGSLRNNLRYRTDPVYRAAQIERAKARQNFLYANRNKVLECSTAPTP